MKVTFCDTCGCPIKQTKYKLITAQYTEEATCNTNTEAENFYGYKKGFLKEKEHEICENCKAIIDQIFECRMIKMLRLSEDGSKIYELPSKENKYEKKNKAKKDKDSKD